MSSRILKRAAATGELLNSTVADQAEEKLLEYEEDRQGSSSKRRKLVKEAKANTLFIGEGTNPNSISNRSSSKADIAVLKKLAVKGVRNKTRTPAASEEVETGDLWANEGDQGAADNRSAAKSDKVLAKRNVLGEGFSYNPAFEAHQEVLAEAFALELRKREDDKRQSEKHLQSVPAIEPGAHESDSSSESEDEAGAAGEGRVAVRRGLSRRQSTKLTRAQRNKIRSRNIAEFQANIERGEKGLLRSMGNIPAIVKDLDAEARRRAVEDELRRLRREEDVLRTSQAMTYAEAGAVPLSDELGGSLRAVLPKGVMIKAMEADMRRAGKLVEKNRRAARRGEKPHAEKNIRWVAKHKYP